MASSIAYNTCATLRRLILNDPLPLENDLFEIDECAGI